MTPAYGEGPPGFTGRPFSRYWTCSQTASASETPAHQGRQAVRDVA